MSMDLLQDKIEEKRLRNRIAQRLYRQRHPEMSRFYSAQWKRKNPEWRTFSGKIKCLSKELRLEKIREEIAKKTQRERYRKAVKLWNRRKCKRVEKSKFITAGGITLHKSAWARKLGIGREAVRQRLLRYPPEIALKHHKVKPGKKEMKWKFQEQDWLRDAV